MRLLEGVTARWRLPCAALALVGPWLAPPPAFSQARGRRPSILVISAGDSSKTSVLAAQAAFERTVVAKLGRPVDFTAFYLGLWNEHDAAQERSLIEIVTTRVPSDQVDVVLTQGVEALRLLLRHRARLRPGLPIVFTEVSSDELDGMELLPPDVTGAVTVGLSRTVEIALDLVPDSRRFVIVGGETQADRRHAFELERRLNAAWPQHAVERLDGRPLDEQVARLAALPPKGVVLFTGYLGDSSGRALPVARALERLAQAANGPIFGFQESELGFGLTGGDLVRTETLAERAAVLAARILQGEAPRSVPPDSNPARILAFDSRQLKRWEIPERRLPPGSVVRFRQPTLWAEYRYHLLGVLALVVAQAVLIAFLVVERRSRRQAQHQLAEAEHRYRTVADFAVDWEYWIRDDGSLEHTSPSCAAVTGYDAADFGSRPQLIEEIVVEEDRDAWRRHHGGGQAAVGGAPIEFRILTRDGRTRWIEHACSRVTGPDGSSQGIRASNRDVTERRQAEESLRRALSENEELRDRLEIDNRYMREQLHPEEIEGVLGTSDAMRYVTARIQQVAPTTSTVLLLGETGVGKTLLAQAIHDLSPRKPRPLVALNCAALPPALVESELFGHEKGAFTGAQAMRRGRFEVADGGTLFLDEVAELPLELQAKLLRAVQDGAFERVGSSETRRTDVRLIAASNRNLEDEVRAGRFRQDLLYRLNVFPITVPPLRQRPDDIPQLVGHLLRKHCRTLGVPVPAVSRATMKALQARSWPGNIRELENVIERALISGRGSRFEILDDGPPSQAGSVEGVAAGRAATLAQIERDHILATLERLKWRIEGPGGAAAALGMNASTLRSRMRKLDIVRPRQASA